MTKTLLQILPALDQSGGGVERGTLDLSRALINRGYNSFVISGGGVLVDELKRTGAEHIELPIHHKSLRTLSLANELS